MLPDVEHYVKNNVKNKCSMTFLSIRTDILHFPLFLLSSMYLDIVANAAKRAHDLLIAARDPCRGGNPGHTR